MRVYKDKQPGTGFATFLGVSGGSRVCAATAGKPPKRRYRSGNTGFGILCAQRRKFRKTLDFRSFDGFTGDFIQSFEISLFIISAV